MRRPVIVCVRVRVRVRVYVCVCWMYMYMLNMYGIVVYLTFWRFWTGKNDKFNQGKLNHAYKMWTL